MCYVAAIGGTKNDGLEELKFTQRTSELLRPRGVPSRQHETKDQFPHNFHGSCYRHFCALKASG